MRSFFAIAFVVLLVAGCGSTPTQPEQKSASFFPLQQGNWWRYSGGGGPGDTSYYYVSSRIMHGGVEYVELMGSHGPTNILTIEELRENASGRVYSVVDPSETSPRDTIILDPTLRAGERAGAIVISRTSISDTVPAGRFSGCVEVVFDGFESVPEVYAPGVGPIRRIGVSGQYVLTEAFVDGVRYP